MYAAYELLERLGVVFQLTGDIIPQHVADLKLPAMNVRMEPSLKYRGLHMRHFVMPWMGLDDFRRMIDQMAKMKFNYLEFYWYVGGPWIEYSHRGEKRHMDDAVHQGFGLPHLAYDGGPVQGARTSRSAASILSRSGSVHAGVCQRAEPGGSATRWPGSGSPQAIDYAHQRKIQIWLGKGDCPYRAAKPGPSTARFQAGQAGLFGTAMPPATPPGWKSGRQCSTSMIETYPKADGYWIWLAEVGATATEDPESQEGLASIRSGPIRQPPGSDIGGWCIMARN